jgi:hypothetical protein
MHPLVLLGAVPLLLSARTREPVGSREVIPPFPFVSASAIAQAHGPLRLQSLLPVTVIGPTDITTSGTYTWQACSSGFTGASGAIYLDWGWGAEFDYPYYGDVCPQHSFTFYPSSTGLTFTGQWCVGGSCTTYDTKTVTVNIYWAGIEGPVGRRPNQSGTWTAHIYPGHSVGPYTYEWSGAFTGTGTSVTGSLEYNDVLYLTVRDANGWEVSSDKIIYVCDDIC